MKISILITTYNLEDSIDACIESVVRQNMPCDWEIIVGDDGSTDNTVGHIKKWIEKYPYNIVLYTLSRDSDDGKTGSRAARNRAYLLEKAKGDYINFLDGDDEMVGREKFTTQFNLLEREENRDCSCCAGNIEAYVIPENRRYLMADKTIPQKKFSLREYWSYHYFHTNTILFRKECKELLLHADYRNFINDNFITFLLLQCGKILFVPEVYGVYNMTGNGLWTGHKSVYNSFRNLQLYDLEMYVCPSISDLIMRKHCSDMYNIINNYSLEDYSDVKSLLVNLNPDIFIYTLLLSKLEQLSDKELQMRRHIYRKVEWNIFLLRGKSGLNKLRKFFIK